MGYKMIVDDCPFCDIDPNRIEDENDLCVAIRDQYPVTELHTLIIPKRHVSSFFDLEDHERDAIFALLQAQKQVLEILDSSISGFNIGVNVGEDGGQTIFHCHVHLIPRRKGDVPEPRGGVRGVIPSKQTY